MLFDFLSDCRTVLNEERDSYSEILRLLSQSSECVGFMPAIGYDLYPVYALSCTSAKNIVSPSVYIVPCGACEYWGKPSFEEIVDRFYRDDEIEEQYRIEPEEMILLENPSMDCCFSLQGEIRYNVLYCQVSVPDGPGVRLLFVPAKPDECWEKVILAYGIKCDIVIDSHKGMGDWFVSTALFEAMRKTEPDLLPRYYFRGLYISRKPEQGFRLVYRIPEAIAFSHREGFIEGFQKEIYEIDWNRAEG